MTEADIRSVLQQELGNIAPEIDLGRLDPRADVRDALDMNSMDFLNFVIAVHRRLNVKFLSLIIRTRYARWSGCLSPLEIESGNR